MYAPTCMGYHYRYKNGVFKPKNRCGLLSTPRNPAARAELGDPYLLCRHGIIGENATVHSVLHMFEMQSIAYAVSTAFCRRLAIDAQG